jgi:hypothetical protein
MISTRLTRLGALVSPLFPGSLLRPRESRLYLAYMERIPTRTCLLIESFLQGTKSRVVSYSRYVISSALCSHTVATASGIRY